MLSKEFESIKRYLNPIQTFNYQYFYIVLKKLFFEHNLFEMCTDDNATSEVLSECARKLSEESGLPLDSDYLELKHYFGVGNNSRSIIIEFKYPFPIETECKFAALVKNSDGRKYMYTSEFHSWSFEFKLCGIDSEGNRDSYDFTTNKLEQFLQAINQKIA